MYIRESEEIIDESRKDGVLEVSLKKNREDIWQINGNSI